MSQFAQDVGRHEIGSFTCNNFNIPNIYFADYTVDAPSEGLIWQNKGRCNRQFMAVIESRLTDLLSVCTAVKLFRHAETNKGRCDIYP